MSKTTSIIIATIILGSVFYFVGNGSIFSNLGTTQEKNISENTGINNSEVKDGTQYITIIAGGGYSPRKSIAKGGVSTKLVIKTNGIYDCSAALIIRSLGYRNILPNTGETIIDAGTPKQGDVLLGVCGMGMYSFLITFN